MNTRVEPQALVPFLTQRYGLSPSTRCSFIRRGGNDHYLVEDGDRRDVLRLCLNGKYYIGTADELRFELDLLDFLKAQGLPVAAPIPDTGGQTLARLRCSSSLRERGFGRPWRPDTQGSWGALWQGSTWRAVRLRSLRVRLAGIRSGPGQTPVRRSTLGRFSRCLRLGPADVECGERLDCRLRLTLADVAHWRPASQPIPDLPAWTRNCRRGAGRLAGTPPKVGGAMSHRHDIPSTVRTPFP